MRSSLPAALLIAAAALSLNACVSSALPGIPSQPGAADPQLQLLAKQAIRYQDKQAQLALGIRYEYGRGVPLNWKYAAQLYLVAAKSSGGGNFSMGAGGKLSHEVGPPRRKGLPEAKARYEALSAKMKAAGYRCTGAGWSMLFC
ncbi:MAG: SEL1-like repeat protein [Sphingomonas sp.]|uniref:SEL1-like repeat protein n=1 Tax=Sphingomonas sp. TaxID=28214 RepID=UPI0017D334F4|nr:SEL1-like repeat protein [Sphingomonas sp.]MBA3666125.1 SEL1-like repeat protein [Sphingomonas sp.]